MEKDFEGKKLLVVNAHPDDEMGYASVLAHYAARGAHVRIVSATLGQKGFRDHTGIDDGEELARVRREELETASRFLGLDPPIALEFVDKELLGAVQDRVRQRIAEVLETEATLHEPEHPVEPGPMRGLVEFHDVEFRYPGAEDPVLTGISFTAEPGSTTAIIGSTGSGKSTLINLLIRA